MTSMSRLMDTIAKNIERMRERCGLTRQQLADAAGVHYNTIRLIEQRRASTLKLANLESIAVVLNTDAESLMKDNEPKQEDKKVEESWAAFINSPFSDGMTEEEKTKLRLKAVWPWGTPKPKAWYHALEEMRASEKNGSGK